MRRLPLAAYLPRVTVRREPDAGFLDFEVSSFSGSDYRPKPAELGKMIDRNRDGKITLAEAKAAPRFERAGSSTRVSNARLRVTRYAYAYADAFRARPTPRTFSRCARARPRSSFR